jgi:raffinose/stachyose/melibiose transport system substrate-binding protein
MFKKLYIVLIVVMALLLASCAPEEAPAPEAPAAAPEEITVEEPQEAEAEQALEKVTLTIESWRNDDLIIWQDVIIPAFNAHYPDIEVIFAPAAPADYNAALNAKLEGGTVGDLITCRPFDLSLGLYNDGHLAPLNDLPGMDNFGDVAKSAWVTDDASTVFCVPMASVIHGFIYNAGLERTGYRSRVLRDVGCH